MEDCLELPPPKSWAEEYRPKGSGERGITGESTGADEFRLTDGVWVGYEPCISSSSRLRLSDSAESSFDMRTVGVYDLGAEVVIPLTASRGGDGGRSAFSSVGERGFPEWLRAEKGTAGHDFSFRSESRFLERGLSMSSKLNMNANLRRMARWGTILVMLG